MIKLTTRKTHRHEAYFLWPLACFGGYWFYGLLTMILHEPPVFFRELIYGLLVLMAVVVGFLLYLALYHTRQGWR